MSHRDAHRGLLTGLVTGLAVGASGVMWRRRATSRTGARRETVCTCTSPTVGKSLALGEGVPSAAREEVTQPEPLESKLRERAMDTFANGYFTIVSIIQGVALGSWALITFRLAGELSWWNQAAQSALAALSSIVTFLVVVVVSYMYFWFTVVMRWGPGILDVLIPMLLGASEMFMAANISADANNLWLLSSGVVGLVGALAFQLSIARADENVINGDSAPTVDVYRVTTALLVRLRWASLGFGILGVGAGILVSPLFEDSRIHLPQPTLQYAFCLLALSVIVVMISDSEKHLRHIFRENNVPLSRLRRK